MQTHPLDAAAVAAEGDMTMKCPKCGSHNVYTVDSRPKKDGHMRRRSCVDCGTRWSTLEIPVDEYIKLKNYQSQEANNDK